MTLIPLHYSLCVHVYALSIKLICDGTKTKVWWMIPYLWKAVLPKLSKRGGEKPLHSKTLEISES